MPIQRLETFTRGNAGVVRVETDDGETGIGQLSPYNADVSTTIFHRMVAPTALGRDPADVEAIVDDVIEDTHKYPGTFVRRALAGLDTALWDLLGKRAGEPVCSLLGGEPEPLAAYGSSMRRDTTPEEEAERLARRRQEDGFEAFKLKIGSTVGNDEDAWPGRTEELVPTVRERLGETVDLYVDANSCYTPERAVEVAEEVLEPNDVVHFEEPCPYWELDWTEQVREATDVPVAGGEQDNMLGQWERIIEAPVVDVVQPDVCYLGGMVRSMRVAEWAGEAGLPVVPHSANRSLVTVFTMHLLCAIDDAGPYFEYSVEDNWAEGLYEPMPTVEDGLVDLPGGPGWGIEVDDDWLARADYRESVAE